MVTILMRSLTGFPFCFMRAYEIPILFFHQRTDPFLIRTTYVGQVMAYEHKTDPDKDIATRTGEFAMLIYSIGKPHAG